MSARVQDDQTVAGRDNGVDGTVVRLRGHLVDQFAVVEEGDDERGPGTGQGPVVGATAAAQA